MAVPTITAISPAAGHTGGQTWVEIDGSNYRTPTPQAAVQGITPVAPPSVAVTFGGAPALEVRWLASGKLWALTPITPRGPAAPAGSVDVVVTNIDDNGNPIPGESATLAQGYAYVLPVVTSDNESDLSRCVRTFLQALKTQITPNVAWPASTDYDDTTTDRLSIAKLASLPAIVVVDFELRENDFYAIRAREAYPDTTAPGGDGFVELAPPDTVDLVFTLACVTNNDVELFNLTAALRRFLKKNIYLTMARDPLDASKGTVSYEMDGYEDKELKFTITANASNVKHSAMTVVVRGFDIETIAGLPLGGPAGKSEGQTDAGFQDEETDVTVAQDPTLRL